MSSIPRPIKRCTASGCTTDAVPGTTRCTQHPHIQRLHAHQSTHTRREKYGPGWAAQRKRIINRDQGCAYCGTTESLEVHHITKSTRPHDRELVTLCRRHHRAIEADAKRGTVGKVGQRVREWMDGQ